MHEVDRMSEMAISAARRFSDNCVREPWEWATGIEPSAEAVVSTVIGGSKYPAVVANVAEWMRQDYKNRLPILGQFCREKYDGKYGSTIQDFEYFLKSARLEYVQKIQSDLAISSTEAEEIYRDSAAELVHIMRRSLSHHV